MVVFRTPKPVHHKVIEELSLPKYTFISLYESNMTIRLHFDHPGPSCKAFHPAKHRLSDQYILSCPFEKPTTGSNSREPTCRTPLRDNDLRHWAYSCR